MARRFRVKSVNRAYEGHDSVRVGDVADLEMVSGDCVHLRNPGHWSRDIVDFFGHRLEEVTEPAKPPVRMSGDTGEQPWIPQPGDTFPGTVEQELIVGTDGTRPVDRVTVDGVTFHRFEFPTVRDIFAASALQGICANPSAWVNNAPNRTFSELAWEAADKMLAGRHVGR